MSERSKLSASHLRGQAFVYLRQSSQGQVERNVESTDRQYALVGRAVELGFAREQVVVIDEDLGISGSGLSDRSGFARLTAEVALGHAGLVLGLEVSRLARNNVDWYRLLDLCGVTDTVIGDADGLYHPGSFNDRLLLGLKGTMSEAELHVLRARLEGGIRNKAKRGELRRGLPVGLMWGEQDGEVLLCPDEAIRGAIATIFERFTELGSVRQVWLWMRREGVQFPLQRFPHSEIQWVTPTYHQVHSVLENPVYAGAYVFGKTRRERYVDEHGQPRKRMRRLPQAEWEVLIWDHHPGFIDRATFEANRKRIAANTRPRAHEPGGAVREGAALLQGIAVCGRCARKLKVHYQGARGHQSPAYHCPSSVLVEGRGHWCLRVGGTQIDQAVTAPSLPSSCETASPVGLLSLRGENWSAGMLDSSKLETVPEIAHRVPQGAVGDRRDPVGASSSAGVPDPELAERPRRRRFGAEYKLRILREAEACTRRGEIGAMLRREGLYTSHLTAWRAQRDAGALEGLAPRKRGPRPASPEQVENERLRRALDRTQADLETARRVIEVQGNVSALLEDLLAPKSATETDAKRPRR